MYSFKISSHVSFPLEGLNMQPFLAKDSPSQVTTYDLLSVICHHGTAGSTRCARLRADAGACTLAKTAVRVSAPSRWTLHRLLPERDQRPVVRVRRPVRDGGPRDGGAERGGLRAVLQVSSARRPRWSRPGAPPLPASFFFFFSTVNLWQEEQRGVGAGAAEGGGPRQHEGAQPAAVLHLQRMAQQVQHVRRAGPHQQPHVPVPARRHVFGRIATSTHTP